MLCKLALGNVRKSLRDFAVYFVTLALGVAVFYAFNTISGQADFLSTESTRDVVRALANVLTGVTVFLAVIMGFLMVYANNYLVKRRKRELGLYQVLGMRPGQVSRVLTLETLFASAASFVVGILVGVVLSQLLVFVTAALFQDHVTYFKFTFSTGAFLFTLGCFVCISLLMLALNQYTLRSARLVDLLHAERVGESIKVRSLPLTVILFVVGCVLIGAAYWRLLHDGLPVTDVSEEAGTRFLITTVMVVVGTLLFFYALSGFAVRVAQRMRGVWYRDLNMFMMRELNAKINTTSISMAVIAMILFLAITSVTGGMSICFTLMGTIEQHSPYDVSVGAVYYSQRGLAQLSEQDAAGMGLASGPVDLAQTLREEGADVDEVSSAYAQVDLYDSDEITEPGALSLAAMGEAGGVSLPADMSGASNSDTNMDLIAESDYNALRAINGLDPVDLGEDGYLITTDMGASMSDFYQDVVDVGASFEVAGRALHPAGDVVTDATAVILNSPMGMNAGSMVVPDDIAEQGQVYGSYLNIYLDGSTDDGRGEEFLSGVSISYMEGPALVQDGVEVGVLSQVITAQESYASANSMTGLVSYLAMYIGFVLVIACAAILAIQQLSGTSDATGRYRLLSELGCPERLIYRSLLRQTLIYFLVPLAVGLAHSLVALKVVSDVVALFGRLDITTPAALCALMFVIVYGGYLLVTYRVSRGVVRSSLQHGLRRE